MTLPIPRDFPPMEAELSERLPEGDGWIYEPKWDGFRCLAFRDGTEIDLRSKSGKPLARYFPEIAETLARSGARRFVVDGELVVPVAGTLVFDELLLRIHPAESRVRRLAAAHPAHLILFDLPVDGAGRDRTAAPLAKRRAALEAFAARFLADLHDVHLSPHTSDVEIARRWLADRHAGLDGVMAKRADLPYASGQRTAMLKVKRTRTADCVVGGFRWSRKGRSVGSLLFGLHDADGRLDHVGFCSALSARVRREADDRLVPLRGGKGFDGRAPSGRSRWRTEGTGEWEPVRPEVVLEVAYDHFTGGRFRHGTRFLRWRPDKDPRACTVDRLEREGGSALEML